MSLRTINVLGVDVACATYETALEELQRLAERDRPAAVAACNTHLISHAKSSPEFCEVLKQFDLKLPDGTPLVWVMNSKGAGLSDRVYGPYLMRTALKSLPSRWKHYFFGGTPECLDRLQAAARALNPDIQIVGTFSPPYGEWDEGQQEQYAEAIRSAEPDFVWVALGGVRQETWVLRNQPRFPRGVFLAVGDAFELVAGNRRFAPAWMQRRGLTWLYRLAQEPRRLWPRYFKYNSLFLGQLMWDRFLPEKVLAESRPIRIAFVGTRGTPARYAGFETVVEQLGSRLADHGHEVTVYNRSLLYAERPATWRGMKLVYLPTIPTKYLETVVHTALSVMHALWQPYDLIYLCGVGNACHALVLRARGFKVVVNVDGIDYKRSKWSGFARWWLRASEFWATTLCQTVIADNRQVVKHYKDRLDYDAMYIAYGTLTERDRVAGNELERWGLKPRGYILCVSRLSPENRIEAALEGYAEAYSAAHAGSDEKAPIIPLVVVGSHGYERGYRRQLEAAASTGVIFTGARYGDAYVELSQNALLFVLPSAIEATRLVLLDQMGFGNAILFRESPATREVIGDAGEAFDEDASPGMIGEKIRQLASDPERCERLGAEARERAREVFSWDRVTQEYETLFRRLGFPGPERPAPTRLPMSSSGESP